MNADAQSRKLTCYIRRTGISPEQWEGFCVEMDIPAVGSTYEEVAPLMAKMVQDYIDYIYERQPDDEQRVLYRPLPAGKVWRLRLENILQHLPFSNRQVKKFNLTVARGIPAQLDPARTQLCLSCKKYRSVGLFEVFHEPNSLYVWYDKTCNVCKDRGAE